MAEQDTITKEVYKGYVILQSALMGEVGFYSSKLETIEPFDIVLAKDSQKAREFIDKLEK